MRSFVTDTIFKRDIFSETVAGRFEDDADGQRIVFRNIAATPLWSRALARLLARRERRALKAVDGIEGVPRLLAVVREGHYRTWIDGTPLHFSHPGDSQYYRDARRLLRDLRRHGITHNDLAKPQNWLARPDGTAAVIDFQLASIHRRRGLIFRLMAYEDLRHLLKQKRAYAPAQLTAREKSLLARKSLPARLWMRTAKPLYNGITRGLFGWSDGEGTRDRLERETPAIISSLRAVPGVGEVALFAFPKRARGTGIYAFVECAGANAGPALRTALAGLHVDHIQPVLALPRRKDGSARSDILRLVALNQMDAIEALIADDKALAADLRQIAGARLNTSDRRAPDADKGSL